MFLSFSSCAKGQTTQTTPLIEVKEEKTREFQTQLLHYFSKSDNKSNHHHPAYGTWTADFMLRQNESRAF